MCTFYRPLEDFESRTLPNVDIGKSPSLTQLPRNFADVDMNSRWTVIALTLMLAYIYPSMRFLPLITLTTTLVHQSSVANLTKRTAPHTFLMESWRISNWKMSSGNHVHSEIDKQLVCPISEPLVTTNLNIFQGLITAL